MKEQWMAVRKRYFAMSKRDRWLLPAALCFSVLLLGYMFGIEPARKEERAHKQKLAQATGELSILNSQLTLLRAKLQDPDAAVRTQLDGLRSQTRNTDEQLKQLQSALVPAQEMSQWLSGLLKSQQGLQLVALKTLSPTSVGDLIAAKAAPEPAAAAASGADNKSANAAAAPTAAASAAERDAWLYRHGVEVTVRGSYHDLIAYLKTLETMPRRVYWGELKIAAQDASGVLMTLTVYTISLEKSWWVI